MELEEQDKVLNNNKKRMLVSASAGSGKTYVMIKYICRLIVEKRVPVNKLLVLTFTKSAATQMKERLVKNLKEQEADEFLLEQLDAVSTANICTIHSFCERTIKKYASVLNLSENFSLLDENLAQNLRENAFEQAYSEFEENSPEDFEFLNACYKHNKNKIKDIIFEIEKLAVAVADREEFLRQNSQDLPQFFDDALKFLHENTLEFLKESVDEIAKLHLIDFDGKMLAALEECFNSGDLFQLSSAAERLVLPKTPLKKLIGEDAAGVIGGIKKGITQKFAVLKSLRLSEKENVEKQKSGLLEKTMLKLFEGQQKAYDRLKKSQNMLDFSDLERYMNILSNSEQLFSGFEYVFVDEYQDTNKIQEKIIKNVAKNCNFVAVGDLKQGIYGFRLASSEIFLKDQQEFLKDENSAVNFLKSNFRSQQAVLDFVNNIFEVCMTENVTGVDYKKTSMLKARNIFVDDGVPAVNIDIVAQCAQAEIEPQEFYSVRNAQIFSDTKNNNLLLDIKRRLQEVLESKISVDGVLRQVRYGDIAILSRSRGAFFEQLENFLQENQIPVMSNSRNSLFDEPEIQVLLNMLKIALVLDDDVALLSVLLSPLGGFSIEDILPEKVGSDKTLCEIVTEDKNSKFCEFNKNLQDFRLNFQIFGLKKAFLQLFDKTQYISQINNRANRDKLNMFVERFLDEVEKFNFDLPALINYLENTQIDVVPEAASFGECVTLTTIHDSKGLEYPIVFLIGCDRSLSGGRKNYDVEVSERFGMALKLYDLQNNDEIGSVRILAGRESEKKKNFVEEIFLFYVALTRAKNRLYLFGLDSDKQYSRYALKDCDSYFDFIFFALPKLKEAVLQKGFYADKNLSVCRIDEISEAAPEQQKNIVNAEILPENIEKIEKYLNFEYKIGEKQNFRLKESVTSLTNRLDEDGLAKFSGENFTFGGKAIEIGNAYHLALKLIDFSKISTKEDLHNSLENFAAQIGLDLIDENILLKNILLLKEITAGGKVFKEKEFLMKENLAGLLNSPLSGSTLVQGVVDLFIIKDGQIVLVDYKYSSRPDEALILKYKPQLLLYKMALEEAFGMKVGRMFLLSLKNASLIEIV